MVAAFYICMFICVQHLKRKKPSDSQSTHVDFLYSIILNICSLWRGAMCFGRPYLPVSICSLGINIIAILCISHPELAEWIAKLSVILSPRSISPGRKRPYPNHLRRKTTAVYSDRLRQSYTTFYGILRLS